MRAVLGKEASSWNCGIESSVGRRVERRLYSAPQWVDLFISPDFCSIGLVPTVGVKEVCELAFAVAELCTTPTGSFPYKRVNSDKLRRNKYFVSVIYCPISPTSQGAKLLYSIYSFIHASCISISSYSVCIQKQWLQMRYRFSPFRAVFFNPNGIRLTSR